MNFIWCNYPLYIYRYLNWCGNAVYRPVLYLVHYAYEHRRLECEETHSGKNRTWNDINSIWCNYPLYFWDILMDLTALSCFLGPFCALCMLRIRLLYYLVWGDSWWSKQAVKLDIADVTCIVCVYKPELDGTANIDKMHYIGWHCDLRKVNIG